MQDINIIVMTILERHEGITAWHIAKQVKKYEEYEHIEREDISKVLQSLKRKGLAANFSSVWRNSY